MAESVKLVDEDGVSNQGKAGVRLDGLKRKVGSASGDDAEGPAGF